MRYKEVLLITQVAQHLNIVAICELKLHQAHGFERLRLSTVFYFLVV